VNFYRPPLEAEFATLTNKYNNFTECGVPIVLRVAHYEAHTIVNRKPTAVWFGIVFKECKIDSPGHLSGDHLSKGVSIQI
jgi:hypothetical protein